ncbi:LysR substrate-binding domain-containing protein [Klebsiella pneumoniae]|nr:LysR substrate-binding domain-containing protein [Klebsiella pneumoniae]
MTLLREGATNGILNVTVSPAFAAKWLLPRIEDFQHKWPDPALRINNSAAVLQAAIDGHGIALARSIMVDDDIKSGRLIRLCPDVSLTSPLSYYLVYRPGCDSLPKIANFRAWIIEQAQAFNHAINPGNLSSKIEPL